MTDDCWDAFGSDNDDESDDGVVAHDPVNENTSKSVFAAASEITFFLAKTFLHENSKVLIGQRRVAMPKNEHSKMLEDVLMQRGFSSLTNLEEDGWFDAIILLLNKQLVYSSEQQKKALQKLAPGGVYLLFFHETTADIALEEIKKAPHEFVLDSTTGSFQLESIFKHDNLQVMALQKALGQIQDQSCLWLPSHHSLAKERHMLLEATVPLSAYEIQSSQLLEPSLVKAVQKMQDYGYCVLPRLLDPKECLEWGQGVLADLHEASNILIEREGVHILNPHLSTKDPESYRELSMREDLRMDLRDGPHLRKLRGDNSNKPVIVNAKADPVTANPFFRLHKGILEVVQRTMNPKKGLLYKGNFGRHNFNGSGPDGSYQDMRLSAIGGIVSLPGSGDQALHADAPHLFEHETLPAHYINAFTPGCAGHPKVGCTAFIHGSHRIEFTAKYLAEEEDSETNAVVMDNHQKVFQYLVRPQLELGDVLLFDCRTLHFGLGNMSKEVERPLLYCNMTHAWFHDPKNWDDRHPIFEHNT